MSPADRSGVVVDLLDPQVSEIVVTDEVRGCDTLVVGLGEDGLLASALLKSFGIDTGGLVADLGAPPTPGELLRVPSRPWWPSAGTTRTLLVAGTGGGTASDMELAAAAVGRAIRGSERALVALGEGQTRIVASALILGVAHYVHWSQTGPVHRVEGSPTIALAGEHDVSVVRSAAVAARATLIARALANTPSNVKSPSWLADRADDLGRRAGLTTTVFTERELADGGFGGLLAVGSGSAWPPRMVQLDYHPPGATRHIVLVGKGITFDTGGLQIKSAEGMLPMKTDMSGAAIVAAVLAACPALGITTRVTGLLPIAENAVSGSAYRPGDVITSYGGRTVEIGNTDAEGRIVMADALAYAASTLAPDVLLDVATLTGAARIALGRSIAPVFATDDALAAGLVAAGEAVAERWWQLPLYDGYRPMLDSQVADLNHIATGAGAGSIIAALFLREFTGGLPWVHLDIAGAGRSEKDRGVNTVGATAFGTRTLLAWLESMT